MDKNAAAAGPLARRAFESLRRLPPAIQDEVFLALQNFAVFVLLFVAFPVLIAVFIAVTIAYALLNWAFGAPSGFLGAALAYGWLGALVTLSVVITVRMWRAIPIIIRLKKPRDRWARPRRRGSATGNPVQYDRSHVRSGAHRDRGCAAWSRATTMLSRPIRPPP